MQQGKKETWNRATRMESAGSKHSDVRVVKVVLPKKVTLEQSPEGEEKAGCADIWKRASQTLRGSDQRKR